MIQAPKGPITQAPTQSPYSMADSKLETGGSGFGNALGASAMNAAARAKKASYDASQLAAAQLENLRLQNEGIKQSQANPPLRTLQSGSQDINMGAMPSTYSGLVSNPIGQQYGGQMGAGPITQSTYDQLQLGQQQSQADKDILTQKGQLAREADARRLALIGQIGSGSSPTIAYGGSGAGSEEAARAAAFARAKEQAGQTALSALTSLREGMAGRGLQGSSMEAQGEAGILQGGMGQVNDFTREQLINDLNRQAQRADLMYQGGITQRGQDLAARNALLGLTMQGTAY